MEEAGEMEKTDESDHQQEQKQDGPEASGQRTATTRLLCPNCAHPNPFGDASQLEVHLARVHFNCRPYPCQICQGVDRFATEQELREHYQRAHCLQEGEYQVSTSQSSLDSHHTTLTPLYSGRLLTSQRE